MSTAQDSPTPSPSRPRRFLRRLLFVGLCLLLLLGAAGTAAWLYVRSERFNEFAARQTEQYLQGYGLRAEVGGFGFTWNERTVKLRDLKLTNQQTGQPIARLKNVRLDFDVPDPYAVELRRDVILKQLTLDGVELFVEIDETGRTNFEGLHQAPPRSKRVKFDSAQLAIALSNAALHLNDRQHKITSDIDTLRLNAQPTAPDTFDIKLNAGAGRASYEGRETKLDGCDAQMIASATGAEIKAVDVRAALGHVAATGKLDDWQVLRYDFELKDSNFALDEIARVFASATAMTGRADAKGRVGGEGSRFAFKGDVDADALTIDRTRLRGVAATNVSAAVDGRNIEFTTARARVEQVQIDDITVAAVAADTIKGAVKDGRTSTDVAAANIKRVEWRGGSAADASLRNIEFSVQGREFQASADVTISGAQVGKARIGQSSAQAKLDNVAAVITGFATRVYGGEATGDATVQLAPNGTTKVKARFGNLLTGELLALAAVAKVPIAGTVTGEADVSFNNANPRRVTGAIKAQFAGTGTDAVDGIPLSGDAVINAQNGVFNFEQFKLATDVSTVTATGRLGLDGDSDLRVALATIDANQLMTVAHSFEPALKLINEYEPLLTGDLKFNGSVTGPIDKAIIAGKLSAASVGMRDALLGSLSGRLYTSPTELRFQQGVLNASNGGTAKFDLVTPLDAKAAGGKLDAVFERLSLEAVLGAVGSPASMEFIVGDVSGEAHLTGLPAAPVGRGQVNLINGKIVDQPAELAVVDFVLDGKKIQLERIEARVLQSRLLAQGDANLDDKTFNVRGKAEQVSLERLAEAFELKNARVNGLADADFSVAGSTEKVEDLNVELTALARKLTINDRDTGELRLTARTSRNGRIDAELSSGLVAGAQGQPEVLKASIELRQPGRPIEVTGDLTELDLAPLLAAFAPELSSSLAGTITGKLRVAGPTVNERGEAMTDQLRGGLTLTATALTLEGNQVSVGVPMNIALDGRQLKLDATRLAGAGIDLTVGGVLGLDEDTRMDFSVSGSANLAQLPGVPADITLSGSAATANARIRGTANAPELAGVIVLNGIGVAAKDAPVALEFGTGRIVLAGNRLTLESFTATAGDGRVEVKGATTLADLRASEWRYDATLSEVEVLLQEVRLSVNGNLALTGTPQGQTLTGALTAARGEYLANIDVDGLVFNRGGSLNFGDFGGFGGGGGGSTQPSRIPPVALNIRIEARDALVIQQRDLNAAASAILTVRGTLDDPNIVGRISAEGGTVRLRGQRYEITTAALDLAGGTSSPTLNLRAEGETGGYRVNVGLVGPTDAIELTLRAEPDLTREEILSLIATGRTESSIAGVQDAVYSGVGTAAGLLTSQLITRPVEQRLGISRFQIDPVFRPNENPAARITLGQQLARSLYFSYSTNLAAEQDQTALLEYTLTNRFSVLSTFTQGGSASRSGITSNNDFTIEIRGRKRFSLGFKPFVPLAADANEKLQAPAVTRPVLPRADAQISAVPGIEWDSGKLRELLPVRSQGFSRSLARLGERRLRTFLQEKGYFFAAVGWRCEPGDCAGQPLRVLYDVTPGERYELKDIRIEGTDKVRVSDLAGELQSQPAGAFGSIPVLRDLPLIGGLKRGLTSNERLARDVETLRRRLVDQGFRAARVRARQAVTENNDLIVVLSVDEGPQSRIADVTVRGNTILPAADLRAVVPVKSNENYSQTRAVAGLQQIKQRYAELGYLETTADLDVVELDDERVRLIYNVNEGVRAVVGTVEVTGTTRTKLGFVRRYYDFKPGDVLTPAKIRQTQRDLYATGAFREVNIRAESIDPSATPATGAPQRVTINLTETKPLLLVYGLGYSTDDGVRGLMELSNSNLFGSLDTATLRLRSSRREQFAQLSFTDPRPFGARWPTTVSAFYNRNGDLRPFVRRRLVDGKIEPSSTGTSFGLQRFAAFIQTERRLEERTSLRLRYNLERANLFNLDNFPATEVTRNERAIRLGMFSVGISRDTRDNLLNPRSGQLLSADHSVATTFLGGNESFNKFFGTYQRYTTFAPTTPVLRDTTFAFSSRLGLAAVFRPTDRDGNGVINRSEQRLPISERFFSGGATTLRGFRFETAGEQEVLAPRAGTQELPTLVPLGGDAVALFNFEMRYPLTQRMRLVPFYDLGNVFYRVRDINWARMTSTVGLGLHFNTPLGPIGVDYGFLIDPPSFRFGAAVLRQPRGTFHIRFGQTF